MIYSFQLFQKLWTGAAFFSFILALQILLAANADQAERVFVKIGAIKGPLGVPLTVYPWYFLCSLWILQDYNTHKYPLSRAYIRISHRGMLVGVHPTIP